MIDVTSRATLPSSIHDELIATEQVVFLLAIDKRMFSCHGDRDRATFAQIFTYYIPRSKGLVSEYAKSMDSGLFHGKELLLDLRVACKILYLGKACAHVITPQTCAEKYSGTIDPAHVGVGKTG